MSQIEKEPRLTLRHAEAAKALGVCSRTLFDLVRRNEIPCVRIGTGKRRMTLFPIAGLNQWLQQKAAEQRDGGADQ
ncbi:MAG: helix-turn-helix domain-containing protein [Planctomycetales bacterium]|nr:helix-turn-helix domain-containing protein [Planctomycetales bacterium]